MPIEVAYMFPLRPIVFPSLLVMFNIMGKFRKFPPNSKFSEPYPLMLCRTHWLSDVADDLRSTSRNH